MKTTAPPFAALPCACAAPPARPRPTRSDHWPRGQGLATRWPPRTRTPRFRAHRPGSRHPRSRRTWCGRRRGLGREFTAKEGAGQGAGPKRTGRSMVTFWGRGLGRSLWGMRSEAWLRRGLKTGCALAGLGPERGLGSWFAQRGVES